MREVTGYPRFVKDTKLKFPSNNVKDEDGAHDQESTCTENEGIEAEENVISQIKQLNNLLSDPHADEHDDSEYEDSDSEEEDELCRAVNPPFLAGRLPVFKAVSLSPYVKRNLHVFENNQFSNIKVIVYENDMRTK